MSVKLPPLFEFLPIYPVQVYIPTRRGERLPVLLPAVAAWCSAGQPGARPCGQGQAGALQATTPHDASRYGRCQVFLNKYMVHGFPCFYP